MKNLFIEIWNEREHVSELSGQPLGEEPNVWFFAHVLTKGPYKSLKFNKSNIMLVTPGEHTMYDHKTDLARKDDLYIPIFDRADLLRQQYFKNRNKV